MGVEDARSNTGCEARVTVSSQRERVAVEKVTLS
jgi:hypothetical protein